MRGLLASIRIGLLDMRGDFRRFGLLIVCLAVGTCLIAGVSSVGTSIREAVERDAALLMGGDLELSRTDRRRHPGGTRPDRGFWPRRQRRRHQRPGPVRRSRCLRRPDLGRHGLPAFGIGRQPRTARRRTAVRLPLRARRPLRRARLPPDARSAGDYRRRCLRARRHPVRGARHAPRPARRADTRLPARSPYGDLHRGPRRAVRPHLAPPRPRQPLPLQAAARLRRPRVRQDGGRGGARPMRAGPSAPRATASAR